MVHTNVMLHACLSAYEILSICGSPWIAHQQRDRHALKGMNPVEKLNAKEKVLGRGKKEGCT